MSAAWLQRTNRMISAQLAAYRQELDRARRRHERGGAVCCPRCGLILAQRLPALQPRHCPRCVARRRAVVELEPMSERDPCSSPPPPDSQS